MSIKNVGESANRCTIKNGNIATFPGNGIVCLPGPGGINASGGSFQHLNVNGCGANGISSGTNWTLEHCTSYNHGGLGITSRRGGDRVPFRLAHRSRHEMGV